MTTITKKNPDKWYWYTILLIFALMALIGIKNCQGQQWPSDSVKFMQGLTTPEPLQFDILDHWKLQRQAQKKKHMRAFAIKSSLMFVSGVADATSEALRSHYDGFKNRFPDARDTFWNPS